MNVYLLGIDEIKRLVRVKMLLDELFVANLRHLIVQVIVQSTGSGKSVPAFDNKGLSSSPMFCDYINVTAERLLKNDMTIPLITAEETSAVVRRETANEAERQHQSTSSLVEKERIQSAVEFSGDFQTKLAHALAADSKINVGLEKQYADYWNWINTISETAATSGVTPEDLPITLAIYGMIAQQVISKSEMMAMIQRIVLVMFDLEIWIQSSIEPALKMAAKMASSPLSENDLRELRSKLEPDIRSYLSQLVPKLQAKAFKVATAAIDMLWADMSSVI